MSNPLLTQVTRLPGATFTLPTRGLFYHNGELSPDVVDGEVHVYPLTSIDEIELKTPDLLFNGKAIENVFKRCIPSILKPMDLTTMDVDYLLVCLRLVSYGSEISVKFNHGCKDDSKDHTYTGSVEDFVFSSKTLTEMDFQREFVLEHSSGCKVTASPLLYKHFIKIMTDVEADINSDGTTLDSAEKLRRETVQLANNISQVQTPTGAIVTEKDYIAEWLATLDVRQIHEISSLFERQTRWGCEAVLHRVCPDCGSQLHVPVSINPIVFFTWS